MNQIISLILAIVGVVLFFAPDNILDKNVQNAQLKMIREYHQIAGAGLIACAYYLYTSSVPSKEISTLSETSTPSEPTSPVPPSYEEATSE